MPRNDAHSPSRLAAEAASPAMTDLTATAELWVTRDRAEMLYGNASGGLFMSAVTATSLVLIAAAPDTAVSLGTWLAGMFAVIAVRITDVRRWRPRRQRRGGSAQWDIRCFAAGTLLSSLLWALFPVLFFPLLTQSRSTAAFVVMAAMAGGSATVLGPSLPLSLAFCAVQLLVPGAVYFLLPGRENKYLGVLAVVMFIWMAVSSRQANRAVISAVRVSRVNQALVVEAERQRQGSDTVNQQLAAAQVALNESNQTLEQRIEERTADLAREMARRQLYADALARLASIDALTGLCNRAEFAQRLSALVRDAADVGLPLAVLFLGIDGFKQVNDVRGNAAGDALLQACSRAMSGVLSEDGLIARWGGDEFIVALPGASRATASDMADALRRALLTPSHEGTDAIPLDASVGIAVFPDDARTQDELIRAADVAMYEAKRGGEGRVRQFDPEIARDLARRHLLEQTMRGGTERGEFSLVFQPIFDSLTARCDAVEALLRWHPPELGPISTPLAIQIAEQTGQICTIGRWALIEACRVARTWPSPAPAVVVNVSVAQVLTGTLPGDVADALAQSGLPPERLYLEITESMFVSDPRRVAPVFETLRRNGHRVLLDDFGTGFSSLAYLSKLPLDVIKIDKSFVHAADRDGYAIIRAILSIARALSLSVTAEGVEIPSQRDTLTAMGVDFLQGYLLARPMPVAAFAAWLAGERAPGLRVEEQAA